MTKLEKLKVLSALKLGYGKLTAKNTSESEFKNIEDSINIFEKELLFKTPKLPKNFTITATPIRIRASKFMGSTNEEWKPENDKKNNWLDATNKDNTFHLDSGSHVLVKCPKMGRNGETLIMVAKFHDHNDWYAEFPFDQPIKPTHFTYSIISKEDISKEEIKKAICSGKYEDYGYDGVDEYSFDAFDEDIATDSVLELINSKRLNRVTVMENLTRPSIKTLKP